MTTPRRRPPLGAGTVPHPPWACRRTVYGNIPGASGSGVVTGLLDGDRLDGHAAVVRQRAGPEGASRVAAWRPSPRWACRWGPEAVRHELRLDATAADIAGDGDTALELLMRRGVRGAAVVTCALIGMGERRRCGSTHRARRYEA